MGKYIQDMKEIGYFNISNNPIEESLKIAALDKIAAYNDLRNAKSIENLQNLPTEEEVTVNPELKSSKSFNPSSDTSRIIYGFLNGAVNVFPKGSLPDLCRNNVTATKNMVSNMFINSYYTFPADYKLAV